MTLGIIQKANTKCVPVCPCSISVWIITIFYLPKRLLVGGASGISVRWPEGESPLRGKHLGHQPFFRRTKCKTENSERHIFEDRDTQAPPFVLELPRSGHPILDEGSPPCDAIHREISPTGEGKDTGMLWWDRKK